MSKLFECKFCNRLFDHRISTLGHEIWCKLNPDRDKNRKRISKIRKDYLSKNRNNICWTNTRNESKPEKLFREIIKNIDNVHFHQWYIDPESTKFYEIDFACPELKIGFEINGNQHYDKVGKPTRYHKKRKKYLESLGWKIIDIHYSLCFKKDIILNIVKESFGGRFEYCESVNNIVINERNIRKKERELKQKEYFEKVENNKKIRSGELNRKKDIILKTIEEFGYKFGLIQEISKNIGLSHTSTRRLMEKLKIDNKWKKRSKDELLEYNTKSKEQVNIRLRKRILIKEERKKKVLDIINRYGIKRGIIKKISKETNLFSCEVKKILKGLNVDISGIGVSG